MNLNKFLDVNAEVAQAIAEGKPVVALESTIISHGMPYPQNVNTARNVEKLIRKEGAVPATIAIIGGKFKVGLSDQEIEYFGKKGTKIAKASSIFFFILFDFYKLIINIRYREFPDYPLTKLRIMLSNYI